MFIDEGQGNGGLAAMAPLLDHSKRVLLLHTGGDSKRVPWANPIGKAFIPLPFLAGDDPDGHIFTLFDHILAISASVLRSFSTPGKLNLQISVTIAIVTALLVCNWTLLVERALSLLICR